MTIRPTCRWIARERLASHSLAASRGTFCSLVIAATVMSLGSPTHVRATADARPLSWGPPILVDHHPPYSASDPVVGMSCPTVSFCAAIDGFGDIVTSDHPLEGSSWNSQASVDDDLGALSCPSATFCVGVGGVGVGDLDVSTDPAGGGR